MNYVLGGSKNMPLPFISTIISTICDSTIISTRCDGNWLGNGQLFNAKTVAELSSSDPSKPLHTDKQNEVMPAHSPSQPDGEH